MSETRSSRRKKSSADLGFHYPGDLLSQAKRRRRPLHKRNTVSDFADSKYRQRSTAMLMSSIEPGKNLIMYTSSIEHIYTVSNKWPISLYLAIFYCYKFNSVKSGTRYSIALPPQRQNQNSSGLQFEVVYWPALSVSSATQLASTIKCMQILMHNFPRHPSYVLVTLPENRLTSESVEMFVVKGSPACCK